MYGYIYLTTNIVNNKKYIGKHKSEVFTDRYKGSGKYLHRAISKYGIDSFKVELIEECSSLEELNEREKYWISHYNAMKSDEFYNIHPGGDGGDISLYLDSDTMKAIRSDHSSYIKNRLINDKEFHSKLAGAKKGHRVSDETKSKISNSQKSYWESVSEEDKHKRLSELATKRNTNRVWITNDIIDKSIKKDLLDKYLSNGYRLGRKFKHRNRKCATTIESIAKSEMTSE